MPKIRSKISRLGVRITGKAPVPVVRDVRLVADAKLSDYRIKRVLRCYAEGMPPKEVMKACRISHVTVYRLYSQVRDRMLHVGLFKGYEQIGAEKDEDEEEGSYFPRKQLKLYLKRELGKHRGIKSVNRPLYAAQKYVQARSQL